jgi:hypothetical protein
MPNPKKPGFWPFIHINEATRLGKNLPKARNVATDNRSFSRHDFANDVWQYFRRE